jgi:hypothetical protein
LPDKSLTGPSPAELRPYCTVSFDTLPTWRAKSQYLYPPGIWWPRYTPGHCVPFSSHLTPGRSTVDVFQPASDPPQNYIRTTWPEKLLLLEEDKPNQLPISINARERSDRWRT